MKNTKKTINELKQKKIAKKKHYCGGYINALDDVIEALNALDDEKKTKHPQVKTRVAHSEGSNAWNVIGDEYGKKYKIARVPYIKINIRGYEVSNEERKAQALEHAEFISYCFNNPEKIEL